MKTLAVVPLALGVGCGGVGGPCDTRAAPSLRWMADGQAAETNGVTAYRIGDAYYVDLELHFTGRDQAFQTLTHVFPVADEVNRETVSFQEFECDSELEVWRFRAPFFVSIRRPTPGSLGMEAEAFVSDASTRSPTRVGPFASGIIEMDVEP